MKNLRLVYVCEGCVHMSYGYTTNPNRTFNCCGHPDYQHIPSEERKVFVCNNVCDLWEDMDA